MFVKGLVAKINQVKEKDAYIELITRDHGKISLFAQGILLPASRLHKLAVPFSLIEVELSERGVTKRILSGEVVAEFSHILAELNLQIPAGQIIQMVLDLMQTDTVQPLTYVLAVNALYALNRPETDVQLFTALVKVKLLLLNGYALDLAASKKFFSQRVDCLMEADYQWQDFPRSNKTDLARVLACLNEIESEKIRNIRLPAQLRSSFIRFAEELLNYCLDHSYNHSVLTNQMGEMEKLAERLKITRSREAVSGASN